MSEFFSKLQSHDIVAVAGGLLIAAITIVFNNWRRVRIAEMEGALKQQMLEKGAVGSGDRASSAGVEGDGRDLRLFAFQFAGPGPEHTRPRNGGERLLRRGHRTHSPRL